MPPTKNITSSHLVFITYGPLKSAAYNRARFLASELASSIRKVSLIVDDIEPNNDKNIPWISKSVVLHRVKRNSHLSDIVGRRKLLRSLDPTYVVHLGSTLKGLVTLCRLPIRVIAEWDEPRHLLQKGLARKAYYMSLRFWMLKRARINIACAEALMKEGVYESYLPHGNPHENDIWAQPADTNGPATYMGNLYPDWDHSLIIKALASAVERNYRPKVRIIGGGIELEKWRLWSKEKKLDNLEFTGPVYGNDMVELLASASVLLYPATDSPVNRSRCSTKLFVYAAVDRPILAHDVGEARNILGGNMIPVPAGKDLIDYLERYQRGEIETLNTPKSDNSYRDRSKRFIELLHKLN